MAEKYAHSEKCRFIYYSVVGSVHFLPCYVFVNGTYNDIHNPFNIHYLTPLQITKNIFPWNNNKQY